MLRRSYLVRLIYSRLLLQMTIAETAAETTKAAWEEHHTICVQCQRFDGTTGSLRHTCLVGARLFLEKENALALCEKEKRRKR